MRFRAPAPGPRTPYRGVPRAPAPASAGGGPSSRSYRPVGPAVRSGTGRAGRSPSGRARRLPRTARGSGRLRGRPGRRAAGTRSVRSGRGASRCCARRRRWRCRPSTWPPRPAGRHLAVTTGLGRNEAAWSDLLTAVDLAAPEGARTVRVRTRVGEPGVTVLGGERPLVVLRHREPGELAAYHHDMLLAAAPACPPLPPHQRTPAARRRRPRRRPRPGHGAAVRGGGLRRPPGPPGGRHPRRRSPAALGGGRPERRAGLLPAAGPGAPDACGRAYAAAPAIRGGGRSGPTTPGGTSSTRA